MASPCSLLTVGALIAASILALGCHRAASSDLVDAGNDADASIDSGLPVGVDPDCSATLGVPCGTLDGLFEIELDADALAGDGTWRFADIGGYHGVLAERDLGEGSEPVVVFPNPSIAGGIQLTYAAVLPDDAGGGIEPIGITDPLTIWNDDEAEWLYAVLAEGPSGYTVYGVPEPEPGVDTDTLPLDDPTGLPTVTMQQMYDGGDLDGFALRGIAHGQTTNYGETLCAYGDGIRCGGDGPWEQWVSIVSGSLNDLVLEPAGSAEGLAVGDHGSIYRCMEWGWQLIESNTTDDLDVVLGTAAGYYVAGENGVYSTLYYTEPESDEAFTSHIASTDIADLFWPLPWDPEALGGIELSGITADDCAFDLKGTEIISCFGAHALEGPVIGSTFWVVPEVSYGRFFLTEEKLFRFTIQED
jgi:hypothetical protein